MNLVCHPVTIRTIVAGRSVAAPLDVAAGTVSLLGGLPPVLSEYERLAEPWLDRPGGKPLAPNSAGPFRKGNVYSRGVPAVASSPAPLNTSCGASG